MYMYIHVHVLCVYQIVSLCHKQKRSNSYIMEDTNYTMELAENFEDENFETKRFKSTKETR